MIFMDFGAWVPKDSKGGPVDPLESFTRFQLAAIMDFHRCLMIFIDFRRFSWFSWISEYGCLRRYGTTWGPYRKPYSIPAGCYHRFSLISWDSHRSRLLLFPWISEHACIKAVRSNLWPPEKALLDSSWLLSSIFIDFLGFWLIFKDFHGFHRFSSILGMDFWGR